MLEDKWRRVPESNRCTRICNPSGLIERKGFFCKRTPFVHALVSMGYEASVNRSGIKTGQRKTVEGAATHLNGNAKLSASPAYQENDRAAIAGGRNV